MEFMREFPDDATCLEHLWRQRFSPDGEHAFCPKCDQERVFKKYPIKNRRARRGPAPVRAPRPPAGRDDL